MDAPTAADIRAWSPPAFQWDDYGFPAPDPPTDPDPLEIRVEWSIGTLFAVTGRTLASITSVEDTAMAQKVIVVFTVMEALGGGEAAIAVLEAPWLKSFTAGSYSETRFSPSELTGKGQPPYPYALWNLLWALMTEEKQDEWWERLTGQRRPAGVFIEPDWGGSPGHRDGSDSYGPVAWGSGIEHPWGW